MADERFYVRYYSGYVGRYGHEFLEYDFQTNPDGKSALARYANNTKYRDEGIVQRTFCVSNLVIDQIKQIIKDSEIMKEDDTKWPVKNKDGRSELEIRMGNQHISFETAKISTMAEINDSADPEGLKVFHYLTLDLKQMMFSLIGLNFMVFVVPNMLHGEPFSNP
ncbi:hypothetical protein MBLNU230_g7623t1 [Neophaeotheca triangularis]